MDAPSGGAPEQAPRWDLVGIEGCGDGIRFLAPYMIVWGYVGIHRRKKYVGGATGGPRGWRARLGGEGRRAPTSWLPCYVYDFISKSSGLLSVQERSSRRFHSVWTAFGIPFLQNFKIGKKNSNSGLGLRLIV